MAESMRQRGRGTWELRVYLGLDPDSRPRRYASRTVHGARRAATVALAELVADAAYSRLRAEAARLAEVTIEFTHAVGDGVHAAIVRAVKPAP